jgi:hypothetical protein
MPAARDDSELRRLIAEYFGPAARLRILRPAPAFGASVFVVDFDRGARHYRTFGSFGPSFGAADPDEPQVTEQSSMDLLYPAHLVFHYERLMSLAFALCDRPVSALLLQGIDRLAISERVYLAVPRPARGARGLSPEAPAIRRLCRRVGLGLIVIGRDGIAVVEEPEPYRPRTARQRALRLLTEFDRRVGDPNTGGSRGRPLVTAYRQDALRAVRVLADSGPLPLAALREASGVAHAARILQRNVYGWFVRVGRGVYDLSESGREALRVFADAIAALGTSAAPRHEAV